MAVIKPKHKKASLKVKDLPSILTIEKSPSTLYWVLYANNKFVMQAGTRNEVLLWLEENPSVIRTAFEYLKTI